MYCRGLITSSTLAVCLGRTASRFLFPVWPPKIKLKFTTALLCCGRNMSDQVNEQRPQLAMFDGLHEKARRFDKPYLRSHEVYRCAVPDAGVSWSVDLSNYAPTDHTDAGVLNKPYADPEIGQFKPKYNRLDGKVDRRSFFGEYAVGSDGRPLNPMGRTGLRGRGTLGKWGPNHAADPVVTRWKRNEKGEREMKDGLPVLQFVAIRRKDTGEWAIPGGMVDPGEHINETLMREFAEEAFDSIQRTPEAKQAVQKQLKQFFTGGTLIYHGYVDDPRNTDNSWMETQAVNYHDNEGTAVGRFDLTAGDDADGVEWMDISPDLDLYASHRQFVMATAKMLGAYC